MVTLALLWLLQTVFLQSFYDWMQLENVKRAAGEIAENMEKEGDYHIVDRIAYENSMQVILTDMDGNILCRVDEYSPTYAQEQESQEEETKKQSWQIGKYRNLPKGYASFLQGLLESPGGYVSFTPATEIGGSHLVYGKLIHCGDKTVALYMNTPMGAVQPTVKILRTILFAVTGLLLFVGFILAFFLPSGLQSLFWQFALRRENLRARGRMRRLKRAFARSWTRCLTLWMRRRRVYPDWKNPAVSCLRILPMI